MFNGYARSSPPPAERQSSRVSRPRTDGSAACVQVAQFLVSGANGGKALRMVLPAENLPNQLEITAADRVVVAIGGQTEFGIGIVHDSPPFNRRSRRRNRRRRPQNESKRIREAEPRSTDRVTGTISGDWQSLSTTVLSARLPRQIRGRASRRGQGADAHDNTGIVTVCSGCKWMRAIRTGNSGFFLNLRSALRRVAAPVSRHPVR